MICNNAKMLKIHQVRSVRVKEDTHWQLIVATLDVLAVRCIVRKEEESTAFTYTPLEIENTMRPMNGKVCQI